MGSGGLFGRQPHEAQWGCGEGDRKESAVNGVLGSELALGQLGLKMTKDRKRGGPSSRVPSDRDHAKRRRHGAQGAAFAVQSGAVGGALSPATGTSRDSAELLPR